jgi:hypothetical protein
MPYLIFRAAPRAGLLFVGALVGCAHLRPPEAPNGVLPLRSVRLYENGVGYFEREGVLDAEGGAVLGVPASHVDDALKTLLVLSHAEAKVSGIEFPSVVSDGAARSLAGLPLEGDDPADYEHVLRSLTGFRIEIMGDKGPLARGRLLDVERDRSPARMRKAASDKGEDASSGVLAPGAESFFLLVVGQDGELSRIPTTAMRTVRPLDPDFSARLQTAADALGGRSAQLRRELRVRASSGAPVRIGYIAETPVWRASYRLVLPHEGDAAALQGWALVHNDTDEPWANVAVELVNGAPDSFLFPMAAPRYLRRSLTTPETELSTVPQLALRTADGLWGDHVEDEASAGGLGLSGIGEGGGGYGSGIGLGRIGTVGHGSGTGSGVSDAVSIGDLSRIASASGKDEGRLFSYRLAEPVSLRAHGSSLLPLLAHSVAAHRFTRFDGDGTGRAAVRLRNESPYILPDGPVAVFESAGFAGETVVHRMLPRDTVFLDYGVDLDESLQSEKVERSRTPVHVTWNPRAEVLQEHDIVVSERRLSIENHAAAARSAGYVLSDVVTNAKVEGADEVGYDERAGAAIAFVTVPSRQSLARSLRVTEARATSFALPSLGAEKVERLVASDALPAAERAVLRAALPHVVALARAERTAQGLEQGEKDTDKDLGRNREHLEAMHGQGQANPIAARIVALEQSRDAGRRALASLREKIVGLRRAAAHALEGLPGSSALASTNTPKPDLSDEEKKSGPVPETL